MGLFSTLFGGSKTKVQQYSTLTPEQQRLSKDVLPSLTTPPAKFDGQVSTTQSGAERYSLKALEQLAMNYADNQGAAVDAGTQALIQILTQGATDFQDYYKNTIYDPALEDFNRDVLPTTRNEFVDQYFSGERRQAELDASRNFGKEMLASRSDIAFKTREADRNAKLQALGLIDDVSGVDINNLNNILAGAGAGDELQQGRLDKEYQKFLDEQGASNERVNQVLQYLGTPMVENVAKTKSSRGILGGVADIAKTYAAFK